MEDEECNFRDVGGGGEDDAEELQRHFVRAFLTLQFDLACCLVPDFV